MTGLKWKCSLSKEVHQKFCSSIDIIFFCSTLGYNEFIKQLEVERERAKMLRKLMIERVTQGWWEVLVGSWGAWLAGATYNKETNHKKSCTRIFVKIMEMRLRVSSYSIFTQNIGQGFKNFFAANTIVGMNLLTLLLTMIMEPSISKYFLAKIFFFFFLVFKMEFIL